MSWPNRQWTSEPMYSNPRASDGRRERWSSGQPLVREPLARRRGHETIEPVQRVPRNVAVVQPPCEFVHVSVKVLRAGVMVDTVQAALQDGPDALNAVGRYRPTGELARARRRSNSDSAMGPDRANLPRRFRARVDRLQSRDWNTLGK